MQVFATFLVWLFIAPSTLATIYNYIITFGGIDSGGHGWICHVPFEVFNVIGSSLQVYAITETAPWCADSGASVGAEVHHDIPISSFDIYITDLGLATNRGDRHYEIGINLRPFDLVQLNLNPRIDMITDSNNVPIGFCSERQGTVGVTQSDGAEAPSASCPSGTSSGSRFGIWLACIHPCLNVG